MSGYGCFGVVAGGVVAGGVVVVGAFTPGLRGVTGSPVRSPPSPKMRKPRMAATARTPTSAPMPQRPASSRRRLSPGRLRLGSP